MAQCFVSLDTYKNKICTGFSHLQQKEEFVDMTLAAEGHLVKVHKSLLALASPYIKEMLQSAPCQHPVLFLNCVSHQVLGFILEYVYTGEVHVPTAKMTEFLEASKALHIIGVNSLAPQYLYNKHKLKEGNIVKRNSAEEFVPNIDKDVIHYNTSQNNINNPQTEKHIEHPDSNVVIPNTQVTQLQNLYNEAAEKMSVDNTFCPIATTDDFDVIKSTNINKGMAKNTLPDNDDVTPDVDMETYNDYATEELAENLVGKEIVVGNLNENVIDANGEDLMKYNDNPMKDNLYYTLDIGDRNIKNKVCEESVVKATFNNSYHEPASVVEMQIPSYTINNSNIIEKNASSIPLKENNYNIEIKIPELSSRLQSPGNVAIEVIDINAKAKDAIQPDKSYSIDIQMPEKDKGPPKIIINSGTIENLTFSKPDNDHAVPMNSCTGLSPLYMISNRGSLQMILNRFIYNIHHKSQNGHKIRWRCAEYRHKHCKAYIDTNAEIIIGRKYTHCHPFHDDKIVKKNMKEKVFSTVAEALSELGVPSLFCDS